MAITTLVLAALAAAAPGPRSAGPDANFLHTWAETREFKLGNPTGIRPTSDGKAVLFLRSGARDPVLSLHEHIVATGETRVLMTPKQLLGGAEEVLSVTEKARRERMRVVDRGFTSFDVSEDGKRVLVPLSGRVYVFEREGPEVGRVRLVGQPGAVDPRFSPDGARVAYVRGQDLYVADAVSGREQRLTEGGTEEKTHGLAEFVAQEEMDRYEGYFWSPDSEKLAYTEVDHKGMEKFTIADPARPEQTPTVFPYPRSGKSNARVRVGIISAAGGNTTWARWDDERYPYVARVIWKEKKAPLTVLVQSRDQKEEALLAVDPATGTTKVLHVEKDDAWLELDRALPRWLPDGSGFLFATERDGQSALELRRPDGNLERTVVPKGFHALAGITEDSKRAYVLTAGPTTTALVEVDLQSEKPPAPLTTDQAEHGAVFSKSGNLFVDTRTARDSLAASTVFRRDGTSWKKGAVLPSEAEKPPFRAVVELTMVGAHKFAAAVVRPRGFQRGRKYPVLVHVYGGPTSLMVRSDERSYLMDQWIADHGAIVVCIDNRGTPRRDRAWSRAVKGSFGRVPLDDQVEGLRALAARYPELDLNRVGIYGWSFGGYMSALAVLRRPDVFRVGVAGAPVVDWRDYDTHYTERYLDVPQANPDGYQESSLLTYAPKLERPLLLVHGTGDDNVYFFHSLKLADALFRAGRKYDFLPLSVTHQVPDAVIRERLWGRVVDFLFANLK